VRDIHNPTDEQNFKLIYASHEIKNETIIKDKDFKVEVKDSVKLKRHVEMY